MGTQRLSRVNELLKREIAGALYRVIHEPNFDLAAVTVTQVATSRDLRHARVFLSIRGDPEAQERMVRQIRRRRKALQSVVGRNVVLKYNPSLRFELDPSVQEGDHILEMIAELDEDLDPDDEEVMPGPPYPSP